MADYIKIGQTKKLYGIKGGLRVLIEDHYLEMFLQRKVLFLNIEGRKIPYFIAKMVEASPFRIIFEDHQDRSSALALTGKEIYIPIADLPDSLTSSLDLTTLDGFTLSDAELGIIGTIKEIQEFPQQLMALVTYQEKDILIPLHENLISNIEMDTQKIFVSLPDGLLEL